ncbi:MAG: SRPBCC domain-containing protein [Amphiplicatus sp.]
MAGGAIGPGLTLKRWFDAPRALVYAAWTEPRRIIAWWATKDAVTLRAEADLRVGGRYRVAFKTPDGETHDVSGSYLEIISEEKLVFTWAWITTPERRSQVTLTFKSGEGDRTLLTLLHEKLFDETARDNHRTGWSEALDNLERYLLNA